jgi:ubiquinone/menaquinone biosynthesis C-methylase UbiE
VPQAALVLADVCDLPFGDGSVSAVVSANMLEHVIRDVAALAEIHRVRSPGSVAALVVPYGRRLYDYYPTSAVGRP